MKQKLIEYLKQTPRFYLLFSGGFDSSAILGCAVDAGLEVMPVWINNGFNRAGEAQLRRQAANLGCDQLEVLKIKPEDKVLKNPITRCYHCKTQIIHPLVVRKNAPVFDGTNASDAGSYRPGVKALREGGVRSPLAELGISADDTREIAASYGADPFIAGLESCLATRFNYRVPISEEKIELVREIEQHIVMATGDHHVRARIDDEEHLRIEFSHPDTFLLLSKPEFRSKVVKAGKKIATFVTIDLEGSRKNVFDTKLGL